LCWTFPVSGSGLDVLFRWMFYSASGVNESVLTVQVLTTSHVIYVHEELKLNDRRIRFYCGGGTMRDPVLAGVLSLIVPGVGQLYNGRILTGILWLIFTPGFWIGTGGTLGWICHLVAAYCAFSYAKEHPVR
jgi:hypothetical protein